MTLDGTALLNLEVLENTYDGGREGTLRGCLDACVTPFGKRRFRQWLCAPLFRPVDIEDRLLAVEDLMPLVGSTLPAMRKALRSIPDLERLLARIHALGSRVAARDHPDGRAVFYENDTYFKRKVGAVVWCPRECVGDL